MENLLLYGIIVLGAFVIVLVVLFIFLSRKIKQLSSGAKTSSLESVIIENNELTKKLEQKQVQIINQIGNMETEISKTIQNISVVRFDALKDNGGMQSFAIGLVDSHKNGVVLSSMYARDNMKVFAKKITNGESRHTLTDEEKQAIES